MFVPKLKRLLTDIHNNGTGGWTTQKHCASGYGCHHEGIKSHFYVIKGTDAADLESFHSSTVLHFTVSASGNRNINTRTNVFQPLPKIH